MSARDDYTKQVERQLAGRFPQPLLDDVLAEARLALHEAFEGLGRPATTEEIEALFGTPDRFAHALAEDVAGRIGKTRTPAVATPDDSRSLLGVPYEVRVPTAQRFASRMWNPADQRLFVPRVFGMGWDLNFGALAVKLHLIRPDDVQDMPFEGVPRAATATLVWGPLAAVAAEFARAMFSASSLPARVPYHFGIAGPDRFASPAVAAAQVLGIPLAALAAIAFFTFVRRSSPLARGLGAAGAPAIALLGFGMWGNAVSFALRGRYLMPTGLTVLVPLVVLFALLVALNKTGLRREWREHGVRGH